VGRFWRSAGVLYPYPVLPVVRSRTEDSHLSLRLLFCQGLIVKELYW
jgi:hypothetical protein